MSPNTEMSLKGVFNPKLLNNLVASLFLKNLVSLLLHIPHFHKAIFVFITRGLLLIVFLQSK